MRAEYPVALYTVCLSIPSLRFFYIFTVPQTSRLRTQYSVEAVVAQDLPAHPVHARCSM